MLEVACATDEHYAAPTAAMLHSLLTHLRGMPARVQILHDGSLSAATLARYAALGASMNARCEGRVVEDRYLDGFPTAQFHKSCWYRVLLPELCPELERILYLDSDLIVADNLGWGELGCYGGGALRGAPTPRIDQLAREGLLLQLEDLGFVLAEMQSLARAHPQATW